MHTHLGVLEELERLFGVDEKLGHKNVEVFRRPQLVDGSECKNDLNVVERVEEDALQIRRAVLQVEPLVLFMEENDGKQKWKETTFVSESTRERKREWDRLCERDERMSCVSEREWRETKMEPL